MKHSSGANSFSCDERKGRPKRGRHSKVPGQNRADRKRLLNNNKTHVNTRGKVVIEKTFDESFVCPCSKQCTTSVPLRLRKRLFNHYWSIGGFPGRCAYLLRSVSEQLKNRSYSKTGLRNRLMARKYTIFGIDVCKTALLKTLQIGPGRITVALKKLSSDKFVDERGKAICGWNKFPSAKIEEVKNHISSFPKYVSHYTRNQTKSKFLHSSLNLGFMYRLYKEKFQNPVSKSFYKKVFYDDFNLRFKVAKKDTCKKCDYCLVKSKTAVGIDRQVNDEWHKTHVDQADFLRKKMNEDLERAKIDDEIETLTFDLQKVLVLPKVPTNIVYYLRQLNLYNFGIHVGSTNQGIFNVWLEHEASKGTQEIGSCLRKYIMSISHPVKKLLLWSDSCGGQNRSIKLVLILMHTLQNHPSLETISLPFLESGHSFLPNDSDFGDMECKLKANERIFTDEQYMQIMRDCRINNKFQVNRMSPNVDFHSVDKLLQYTTNRKKDSNKAKVSWMGTHEIVMEKPNPLTIKMKKIIDGESQSVNLAKKGCHVNGFKNIKLEQLWPEGRPLSQEKIKDLETMMYLVDDNAKSFYDFLKNVRAEEFVDDLEGFGQAIDFDLEFQDE